MTEKIAPLRPLKILLVSTGSGARGGGEIFLLYLADALARLRHEPLLLLPDDPAMDELAARAATPVHRFSYTNTYRRRGRSLAAVLDRRTTRHAADSFAQHRPDLIHLNRQNLEDGLDLLPVPALLDCPAIATTHITQSAVELGARAASFRDQIARVSLRRHPMIQAAVSDLRARSLSQMASQPCHAIYNAVPEPPPPDSEARSSLRASLGISPDHLLFVTTARLVPQKDPEGFVQAAQALHAHAPSCRFLWVGDGAHAQHFDRAVVAAGLSGIVLREPWTSRPRSYLAAADLYLHSSRYDGLPLSILEALAAGLPCLVPRSIAAEAKPFSEENLLLFDDPARPPLAALDPAQRARYAAASATLYQAHFRPESMAASYLDLYALAMGQAR
jgi:glycosyltransferase involved in cell wall biosynthesis